MFKGFIINKFRGDLSLLKPGVEMIECRLGLPCAGVVPYIHKLGLEEEDGVAVEERLTAQRVWDGLHSESSPHRPLRVGVIALPHMSNFTDFDALAAEPSVALAFLEHAGDGDRADVLILPGTKQTVDDLEWVIKSGFADTLVRHQTRNKQIIGVCGGLQMLGLKVSDPTGVENNGIPLERQGLGLLSVRTIFGREKTTRPVTAELCGDAVHAGLWQCTRFHGYEIHMGETERSNETKAFARLKICDGVELLDGAVSANGLVFGTYIHGIFDDDAFRHSFIDWARARLKLAPCEQKAFVTAERQRRIDRWADHLRLSLRLDLIRSWVSDEK